MSPLQSTTHHARRYSPLAAATASAPRVRITFTATSMPFITRPIDDRTPPLAEHVAHHQPERTECRVGTQRVEWCWIVGDGHCDGGLDGVRMRKADTDVYTGLLRPVAGRQKQRGPDAQSTSGPRMHSDAVRPARRRSRCTTSPHRRGRPPSDWRTRSGNTRPARVRRIHGRARTGLPPA